MKTMKNTIAKFFAAAASICLVAVGCTAIQEENVTVGNREIKFKASVGSFQVKATDTSFESGDAIGLFAGDPVDQYNVRLVWQNGTLTPETPIYWGEEQLVDQSTLFCAYYPYNEELEDNWMIFSVKEDQTTHEAYTASDLMFASTYSTPAEGEVNLTFVHKLAKIVFNIENKLESDAVAEVILGNVYGSFGGYVDSPDEFHYGGEQINIKAAKGYNAAGEVVWSAILPPQAVKPTVMLITESGKEYVYNTDNTMYFYPSTRYNASIILDETSVTANLSADVADWLNGNDFWFNQNNPSKYLGEWSVFGAVQGSEWEKDIPMRGEDFYWYTDISCHAGEEFVLRMNGGTITMGLTDDYVLGNNDWRSITEKGYNLSVYKDGVWHIELNLLDKYIYVYRVGDIVEIEGDVVWSGSKTLEGWNTDDSFLGDEDMWLANGLQIGDEIRVYFNANGDWGLDVWSGHWEAELLNWSGYDFGLNYASFYVSSDYYNVLTSVQEWGGGLIVFGDGCEVVAVTIIRAENNWSIIGSMSDWSEDIWMERYGDDVWATRIAYHHGEEFKFRKNGSWDENLGLVDYTYEVSSGWGVELTPYGANIKLDQSGYWWIEVHPSQRVMYVNREGDLPEIAGTTEDYPFNVAQAISYIQNGGTDQVYVQGIVSRVLYTFNASYGTATFWISDDGVAYGVSDDNKSTSAPDKDFECYSVYWLGNTPWEEGMPQVEVGDKVIVYGSLTQYKTTYETASKKAYIHAIGKNVWDPSLASLGQIWYSPADWSGGLEPSIEYLDNGFTFVVPEEIGGYEWMGQNWIYNPYNPSSDKKYHLQFNLFSNNYDGSYCTVKLMNSEDNYDTQMLYKNDLMIPYGSGYHILTSLKSYTYDNGLVFLLDLGRCAGGESVTLSDIKLFEF